MIYCLNNWIREQTNDRSNLDDVFRLMYDHFKSETDFGVGETGQNRDIPYFISKSAGLDESKVRSKILKMTESRKIFNFKKAFRIDGIKISWDSSEGLGGWGKTAEFNYGEIDKSKVSLGARFSPVSKGLKITLLNRNGSFARAGIAVEDIVVAIDGQCFSGVDELDNLPFKKGDELLVHVIRGRSLLSFKVKLLCPRATTCYLNCEESS